MIPFSYSLPDGAPRFGLPAHPVDIGLTNKFVNDAVYFMARRFAFIFLNEMRKKAENSDGF